MKIWGILFHVISNSFPIPVHLCCDISKEMLFPKRNQKDTVRIAYTKIGQ